MTFFVSLPTGFGKSFRGLRAFGSSRLSPQALQVPFIRQKSRKCTRALVFVKDCVGEYYVGTAVTQPFTTIHPFSRLECKLECCNPSPCVASSFSTHSYSHSIVPHCKGHICYAHLKLHLRTMKIGKRYIQPRSVTEGCISCCRMEENSLAGYIYRSIGEACELVKCVKISK